MFGKREGMGGRTKGWLPGLGIARGGEEWRKRTRGCKGLDGEDTLEASTSAGPVPTWEKDARSAFWQKEAGTSQIGLETFSQQWARVSLDLII